MAVLINGNGNKAIYANQDADLIASLVGDQSCISAVGSQMAATAQDANTIAIADGVCITKEGRRIQLDNGKTDIFEIPTGESGVTNYYIIGYHLYTEADSSQKCETFVEKMANGTATITEDTFRGGATEVYVSLYRITQVGFNISTIAALLVSLANLKGLKSDLSKLTKVFYVTTDGVKNYGQLLTELNALISNADLSFKGTIELDTGAVFQCSMINFPNDVVFTRANQTNGGLKLFQINIRDGYYKEQYLQNGGQVNLNDFSQNVPSSGKYIYYRT